MGLNQYVIVWDLFGRIVRWCDVSLGYFSYVVQRYIIFHSLLKITGDLFVIIRMRGRSLYFLRHISFASSGDRSWVLCWFGFGCHGV